MPDNCSRVVPTRALIAGNLPTVIMCILGAVLMGRVWWPAAIIYLVYCAGSVLSFWAIICPYCAHFGTQACPCGYGAIAGRLFERKQDRAFQDVFRKNIAIVYPWWFVPLGAGLYLLWRHFDYTVLGVFLAFVVVGFVVVPGISRRWGCGGCEMKDRCPWMSKGQQSTCGPSLSRAEDQA